MREKISVIVPIYNVEKYLNRCIESIVNQTYQNLEIILVDDGSPDQCPEICDQWALKDSRIKVIHKENGGLSDARNKGMEIASGDYIGFIDSDDWIHFQMYEKLYQVLKEEQAQIAACNFQKVEKIDKEDVNCKKQDGNLQVYGTEEALKALITEQGLQQVVWNKLYKKDLLDNLEFAYGKYNEDEFWSYQVIARAKKTVTTSYQGYYYFQRQDSIIGDTYSLKRLDGLEGKIHRQAFIDQHFSKLSGISRLNLFYSHCYAYQCCLRCLKKDEMKIADEKIRKGLEEYPLQKSDYQKETRKQKTWINLYKMFLKTACQLRNWLKIGL